MSQPEEHVNSNQQIQNQEPLLIHQRRKSTLREYGEAFLIAFILALIIKSFLIQAFKIPSSSMEHTLLVGDHLLVNKFIYKFKEPLAGDIIVFKFPDDSKRDFIKRIVGTPGDKVEVRDKRVYVNSKEMVEPYAIREDSEVLPKERSVRDNFGPITVPKDSYFVMGDNRDRSWDSRFWNNMFVKKDTIIGKAFIIYWSWKPDKEVSTLKEDTSFMGRVAYHSKIIWHNLLNLKNRVRWERFAKILI
jgi:signal peptidase I